MSTSWLLYSATLLVLGGGILVGIAHQNVRSIAEVAFTRSLVAEDSSGSSRP